MGKRIYLFILILLSFTVGCQKNGDDIKVKEKIKEVTVEKVQKPIIAKKVKGEDAIIGINMMDSGGRYIRFYDHFGWFVYDKDQGKVVGAIDLAKYGLSQTQGSDSISTLFDEEEVKAYFHNNPKKNIYCYDIKKGTVEVIEEELLNSVLNKESVKKQERDFRGEIVSQDIDPWKLKYREAKTGEEYLLLEGYDPNSF